MTASNHKKVYKQLKLIISQGRKERGDYFSSPKKPDYIKLGYNFRMSSITAALGAAQLSKISKIIKMRKKVANYYNLKLSKIAGIEILLPPKNFSRPVPAFSVSSTVYRKAGSDLPQGVPRDRKPWLSTYGIPRGSSRAGTCAPTLSFLLLKWRWSVLLRTVT